jgi:hypothetical protein
VDVILYGYEPDFSNTPEFSWDFEQTATLFTEVSNTLRGRGFQAGGYPTGRPVLQNTFTGSGWSSYGWHYGQLRKQLDWLIVQTQTYCVDGTSRYAEALDKVGRELSEQGHSRGWHPQVTIAPSDTNTNSVSVAQALECTEEAASRGLPGIMVWWSPRYVEDMVEYLRSMGRE